MIRISGTAAFAALAGTAVAGVLVLGISSDVALAGNGNGNNGNGNGNGGSAGNGATPPPKALVVKQVTTPASATQSVAPGSPGWVTVSVNNPNNQAVVLTGVTGTVTSVATGTRPGLLPCNKSWISIQPWTSRQTLAANGTTTVKLATTFNNLSTTNQDNCKGVAFNFSFTATGDQA